MDADKIEGHWPTRLKRLAKRANVETVSYEPWEADYGGSVYWLWLRPGLINTATETHFISEQNIKSAEAAFKWIEECSCERCLKMIEEDKQDGNNG